MSPNPHRNRGKKTRVYSRFGGSRRQLFRVRTKFSEAKGLMVLTPDGFGVNLGDSNKRGIRKFSVRLEDGRIRHYSQSELHDPIGDFTEVVQEKWETRFFDY